MMGPAVKLTGYVAPVESPEPGDVESVLAEHLQCVGESLEAVEQAIRAVIEATPTTVREVASHLANAGGKRLRPALVLLWARIAGGLPTSVVHRAVCCEGVHLASLLHDDVIDSADRRRGRASCNCQWGNKASVLVADRLLSGIFHDLTTRGDVEALETLSDAVTRMCDAELGQTFRTRDLSLDESDCIRICEGKTGSLMAACCRLGALAAARPDLADMAARFGAAVGTAFQIADDILDLSGNEEEMGKPLGQDLADGRMTLPILYALQAARPDKAAALKAAFMSESVSPEELRAGVKIISRSGALDHAHETAARFAAEAKAVVAPLEDSAARAALVFVADYVVARNH